MTEQIKKTIENLKKNNINAVYIEKKQDIKDYIEQLLPLNCSVTSGGSQTMVETGVSDLIKSDRYNFIDRFKKTESQAEKDEITAKIFTADYFFASCNAVTENGEIVNVDGTSNRVAAIMYGPKKVYLIVGSNKIVKDIDEGFLRIKKIAAPKNTVRLNCATYCREKGECVALQKDSFGIADGCGSNQRICCNYTVNAHQSVKDRINVIICGDSLGY